MTGASFHLPASVGLALCYFPSIFFELPSCGKNSRLGFLTSILGIVSAPVRVPSASTL